MQQAGAYNDTIAEDGLYRVKDGLENESVFRRVREPHRWAAWLRITTHDESYPKPLDIHAYMLSRRRVSKHGTDELRGPLKLTIVLKIMNAVAAATMTRFAFFDLFWKTRT